MRGALVFTGHLRDTCETNAGIAEVALHAAACRKEFRECDIFLHTWDRLDKGQDYMPPRCRRWHCKQIAEQHNKSAWPCVTALSAALDPLAAVVVERQDRELDDEALWTFGPLNQSLRNFRMNTAAMVGGVDLVSRHAAAMNHTYAAIVRMRADVGSRKMRGKPEFHEQFLNANGWRRVGARAAEVEQHSTLATSYDKELVLCDRPRLKRTDFCFWSSPAAPVLRVVESFRGHAFTRLARARNESARGRPVACLDYLERNHAPPYSENLLLCALHEHNLALHGMEWLLAELARYGGFENLPFHIYTVYTRKFFRDVSKHDLLITTQPLGQSLTAFRHQTSEICHYAQGILLRSRRRPRRPLAGSRRPGGACQRLADVARERKSGRKNDTPSLRRFATFVTPTPWLEL